MKDEIDEFNELQANTWTMLTRFLLRRSERAEVKELVDKVADTISYDEDADKNQLTYIKRDRKEIEQEVVDLTNG